MKRLLMIVFFFAGCLVAFGGDYLGGLSGVVKVGSINTETIRNDAKEKIEVLKFHTSQDQRDKKNFRIRITVELKDEAGETYFAQINREQGALNAEYTGEDDWVFQIPHGNLSRPKVTAYVVQYGVLRDGEFVTAAEKTYKAESADEITGRVSAGRVEFGKTLHSFWFQNQGSDPESSQLN